MRRYARVIWVLIIGLVIEMSPAYAASKLNPNDRHMLGFWGSLGYSGLLHNRTESKIPSGVAPAIGVGYRYSHNNFIFQTGLEGQYAWMTCVMPLEIYQQRMVDSDINHEPFMMTAAISDRKEVYQTANVQLPLYVGYERGYFYALAGVTAGLNVYGTASSKGTLDTRAEYERLIGVMEEMPNHGLTRIDVNSGSKTFHTNINVMAHVEIGGRLDKFYQKTGFRAKRHTHRLYLAAFADYGVLNVHQNTSAGELIELDFTEGVNATVTPLLISNQMLGKRINPLVAGVKFTVMFELPKHGKSYIYDYYKVTNGYIKRGGNQSIIHE